LEKRVTEETVAQWEAPETQDQQERRANEGSWVVRDQMVLEEPLENGDPRGCTEIQESMASQVPRVNKETGDQEVPPQIFLEGAGTRAHREQLVHLEVSDLLARRGYQAVQVNRVL